MINAPQPPAGRLTSGSGELPGGYLPSGNPSGDLPSVSVNPEVEQRTSYSTPDAIDLDDYWTNRQENSFPDFDFDIPANEIADGATQAFGWKKDFLATAGGTFVGNLASDTVRAVGQTFSGENSIKVNVEFPDAETLQTQLNEIVAENPLNVPVMAVVEPQATATLEEAMENQSVGAFVQEAAEYQRPVWTKEYGLLTPFLESESGSVNIGGIDYAYPYHSNFWGTKNLFGLTKRDERLVEKNPSIYGNVITTQDFFERLTLDLSSYSPDDTIPIYGLDNNDAVDLLDQLQNKFPDLNFEVVPEISEEAGENLQSNLNNFRLELPVTPVISGSLSGYDWGNITGETNNVVNPANSNTKHSLDGMAVVLDDRIVGVISEKMGSSITGWG